MKDLPSAMDAADSLVYYKLGKSSESDSESPTRVNPLQLLNAIHTESSRLVH